MLLPYLLCLSVDVPAMDRFLALMARTKTMSVNFSATVQGDSAKASGTLIFKRPDRLKFKANWNGSTYVFAIGAKRAVEYETSLRQYAEFAPTGEVSPPLSRLSGTADFLFPTILLSRTRVDLLPDRFHYQTTGKAQIGGKPTDSFSGSEGGLRYTFWVDSAGRLLRYSSINNTGDGLRQVQMDFTGYQINQAVPDSTFDVKVPGGFEPVGTAMERQPLGSGAPFPAVWRDHKTKALSSVWLKGACTLVIVASPDDVALTKAIPLVKTMKVRSIAVTTDPSGAAHKALSGFRVLYDPSGQALDRLRAPGTPMFYVVNGSGRIVRTWLGFDVANSKRFASEVKAAIAATR